MHELSIAQSIVQLSEQQARYVDGEGQCCDCETVFPIGNLFSPCPNCGSYLINITKGRELRIKSIVIK